MRVDTARFDKVTAHPDYASAPAQPVLPTDSVVGVAAVAGPLLMSLFGAVFLLIAISLLVSIRPPLWFAVLFVAGGLVFVISGLVFARSALAVRDAPIARVVAVIVKERTEIKSSNDSTDTTYYATLQTRDGQRAEYRVSRALVGRLVVDDIGVAYIKEVALDLRFTTVRWLSLVEFIRFDV